MVKSSAPTVTAFLKEAGAARRPALAKFRKLARERLPGCEEVMDYGMAVYKKDGAMITAFANQKGYIAFYAGQTAIQAHKKELASIDCGKGCISYKTIAKIDFAVVDSLFKNIASNKL